MGVRYLKGSKIRDEWRYIHKRLKSGLYGMDIDFVTVKTSFDGIAFAIDLKYGDDDITKTEHVGYTDLVSRGIPVFIIEILDVAAGYQRISEYSPEDKAATYVATVKNWDEYEAWEIKQRNK